MTDIEMLKALEVPSKKIDAVLDTDAYNEVDDQFAIAYMLRSDDKINTKAIYAAPFDNERCNGPKDGVRKSYDELKKILTLCGREDMIEKSYLGSEQFLPDEKTPVISDAAKHLVELSKNYTREKPLYVVAIGAITNVASAIIMDASIVERIVIVWLGGNALNWSNNYEFNLKQDIAAARVVFGCGAPLVQLPCMGVVSAFYTNAPELDRYLTKKNPLADYLSENTIAYMGGREKLWSKVIWDVTAVAWLLNDDGRFMRERTIHAPVPEYDHKWSISEDTHFMKYVWHINRDALISDLFEKVSK